jgi:HSP20 family molecular chaperone IbpA
MFKFYGGLLKYEANDIFGDCYTNQTNVILESWATDRSGKKWKEIFDSPGLVKEWLYVTLKDATLELNYKPPKDGEPSDFVSFKPWTYRFKIDRNVLKEDIRIKYKNGILVISCDSPERTDKTVSVIPVE